MDNPPEAKISVAPSAEDRNRSATRASVPASKASPESTASLQDASVPSTPQSSHTETEEPEEVKPMYQWLAGKLLKPIRRWTAGTARVDLRRPCLPMDHQPGDNLWRVHSPTAYTGARMKLMRDLQLFRREGHAPWFSLGMGCSYEMDSNSMALQARLKVSNHLTLKLLPYPMVRVHGSLPLLDTGLVATLHYTCPFVEDMRNPFEPPARLMLRLDNVAGSGIHFSPSGVELDEKVVTLGTSTSIRVAAGVGIPRQLPVSEDDRVKFQIHRLGLKTAW